MLQDSGSNFRTLVENAQDGIVILTNDGCARYANKRACEITGYSRDELTAADFVGDVAQRDDHGKEVSGSQMMIAGGQETDCVERKLIHQRGEMLWIELSATRTVWDGQPAMLVIFRDITKRKCTEEALIASCTDLECRIGERDLELRKTVKELDRSYKELEQLKIEGEKINSELMETNNAVSILARNINNHRLETGKTFAATINSKIMPIVENLRQTDKLDELQSGLDVLDAHLKTLAKELTGEMETLAKLTPSEVKIATMIKNGLKNREIAEKFYISLQTVKTHRRNIRKKLNIQTPGTSLAYYLKSIMG